ncbi:MAG TPA: Mpo1-like protein [Steroidobacteraceae bacterium]
MRTAAQWLDEYGASHRNPTNEALHWFCVPVILWCVLGLLWVTPFPSAIRASVPFANWATVITLFALLYYSLLSVPLALGILPLLVLMLFSLDALSRNTLAPMWMICAGLFVLAWIGQFIGHAIEKKRPSFFKDVQFLMIGPMWLLANVYRRLGIRFSPRA